MRKAKRTWRFIIVAASPNQFNPYIGVAFTIYGTSARKALLAKAGELPEGRFFGVVYEPCTRRAISTAVLERPRPAVNTPHNDDFFLPVNVPLSIMEGIVRNAFKEWW